MAKAVRIETTQLKPAQQVALESLAGADARDLTRARYEELTGVSRSQAAYDLAELVEAGLLVRIGAGRATRYRLASAAPGDSSRRRWTDERIREELAAFCSGRTRWPSAAEFRRAGRSDLYVAASRYGGIGFWAAELGFPPVERRRTAARASRPLPRRAPLAIAAALVLVLGAGVAALALRTHRAEPAAAPTAKRGKPAASYLEDVRSLRRARIAGLAAHAAAARAAPSHVALVLRASRGDSWISVRSATGRLLAERTLAAGTALHVRGTALWIRLGAAANVDLSTNGSRAHPLPSRAAVVVVTARGMRVTEQAPAQAAPELAASRVAPAPAPTPVSTPPAPAPRPKPKPKPKPAPPPAQAKPTNETGTGSSWPTPLPAP